MLLSIRAALAAVLLGSSVPAMAGDQVRQVKVMVEDLDLTAPAGLSSLERRVDRAVRIVCPREGDLSLQARIAERACVREAKASAAAGVTRAIARTRQSQTLAPRPRQITIR